MLSDQILHLHKEKDENAKVEQARKDEDAKERQKRKEDDEKAAAAASAAALELKLALLSMSSAQSSASSTPMSSAASSISSISSSMVTFHPSSLLLPESPPSHVSSALTSPQSSPLSSPTYSHSSSLTLASARREIFTLSLRVSNLERVVVSQRDGLEGCLGFVPSSSSSTGVRLTNAHTLKEKKYEESIQDMQFQMLYGDTSKDVQCAMVTQQYGELKLAHEHERREREEDEKRRERKNETKVEEWIMKGDFTAIM